MSPEIAVLNRLLADTAVAALVAARIYKAGSVPQSPTFPLATFQLISSNPAELARGVRVHSRRPRVQIDVYGTTSATVHAAESAIERALLGQSWITTDADTVKGIFQASGPGDLPADDVASASPGTKLHRRSVDYFVHFRKAA